jgi:hypothetical protein
MAVCNKTPPITCRLIAGSRVPIHHRTRSEQMSAIRRRTMRTATKLAEDYISLWNETDAARRRALLAATWTPGACYLDPLMKGAGHGEIDALIAGVQQRFPAFRFSMLGAADGHGDVVRFSWALGPQDGEAVVKGTDFVRRDGDKIAAVTGFLDHVPAAS